MRKFRLWNNVFGWLAFAVAAFTYLSTMEPTASFWDCPEFIATACKLEVGHPPGAPFFMLLGHLFTLFASDVAHVAVMVNTLSALMSALTIMFLFWTITMLAEKVVSPDGADGEYSLKNGIAIIGAGLVGSLAYAFTDSFWFSAVEGEVYATSAMFTAVVFWAILKWEKVSDRAYADRWLLLIAYLMGLSVGVHLLNLLCIPAIVLVYYFKKFRVTKVGTCIALLVSFGVLGVIMYGIIPGVTLVASWFELLFVNGFGFGFNSGFVFYCLLLFASLVWAICLTYRGKRAGLAKFAFLLSVSLTGIPFIGESVVFGILVIIGLGIFLILYQKLDLKRLNTILLAMLMIVVGYSSYAVIVIRSTANPPMDQDSPDNVFALKSYLNREQYGDRPLFYGPYFNAEVKRHVEGDNLVPDIEEKGDIWSPQEKHNPNEPDRYIVSGKKQDYVYMDEFCTLFPRMYSSQPSSQVDAYKDWVKFKGHTITYDIAGQSQTAVVPTFGENLKFFFDYQVMYMYMRYFMWNFSGRQNDEQGYGEIDKGNVLTGIPFIDKMWEGSYDNLPDAMKDNKGRNVYYMLPLILGLLGFAFQLGRGKRGKETFALTGILFFMTGLAIVLYLNQTPYQPRERDYAYAGSFYAYAIWIGFGVLMLISMLNRVLKDKGGVATAAVVTVACLLVPMQMASQNWDDHDRSIRYTCRDFGYDYLISCAPNAIIFTNGDNDTFPLWYLQEVEGVRRDVRVCNLSYLQTDWYIDQMRRQAYESDPLPISWKRYQYVQGTRDVVNVYNIMPVMDAKTAIHDYLLNDQYLQDGTGNLPSKTLTIPVDIAKYRAENKFLTPKDTILPYLTVKLNDRIFKHEEMILEMLSQNKWKRPIYFSVTVGNDYYMGMDNNFQLEGLAYRIVPMQKPGGYVETDIMYDNMMHKFRWGNISNPHIYLDENNMRMCKTFRLMFYRLVDALVNEGKKDKALKALDYCMKVIPGYTVPHDYTSAYLAQEYYILGQNQKGDALMDEVAKGSVQGMNWFASLSNPSLRTAAREDIGTNLGELQTVLQICQQYKRTNMLKKYASTFNRFVQYANAK